MSAVSVLGSVLGSVLAPSEASARTTFAVKMRSVKMNQKRIDTVDSTLLLEVRVRDIKALFSRGRTQADSRTTHAIKIPGHPSGKRVLRLLVPATGSNKLRSAKPAHPAVPGRAQSHRSELRGQ